MHVCHVMQSKLRSPSTAPSTSFCNLTRLCSCTCLSRHATPASHPIDRTLCVLLHSYKDSAYAPVCHVMQRKPHSQPTQPSTPCVRLSQNAPVGKEALTVLRHHKDAVVAAHWSTGGDVLITADKAGVVAFWGMK